MLHTCPDCGREWTTANCVDGNCPAIPWSVVLGYSDVGPASCPSCSGGINPMTGGPAFHSGSWTYTELGSMTDAMAEEYAFATFTPPTDEQTTDDAHEG